MNAIATQLRGSAKKLASCIAWSSAQPWPRAASAAPTAASTRRGSGARPGQPRDHRGRGVGRHLAQRAHRRGPRLVDPRLGGLELRLEPRVQRRRLRRRRGLGLIHRLVDLALRRGPRALHRRGQLGHRRVRLRLLRLRRVEIGGDVHRALLDHRAHLGQADARQQEVEHGEDHRPPVDLGRGQRRGEVELRHARRRAAPGNAARPAPAGRARCAQRRRTPRGGRQGTPRQGSPRTAPDPAITDAPRTCGSARIRRTG